MFIYIRFRGDGNPTIRHPNMDMIVSQSKRSGKGGGWSKRIFFEKIAAGAPSR